MSIEALPSEILEIIFDKLKGHELARCRAVCRRWRHLVDSLSDRAWERRCCREFWSPILAKEHGMLTYRELYQSLSLWDKVEEARLEKLELPVDPSSLVIQYRILKNNIIALVTVDKKYYEHCRPEREMRNAIEYYDSLALKFISRTIYNFAIWNYDENDKFIMLAGNPEYGSLHIIMKSNNTESICSIVNEYDEDDFDTCYAQFSNSVYFLNTNRMLCVARVKGVNEEEKIEIEELAQIEESLITLALTSEDVVKILTYRRSDLYAEIPRRKLYIYSWQDMVFQLCGQIDYSSPNIVNELKIFGFSWSDPCVYSWLRKCLSYVGVLVPLRNNGSILHMKSMVVHTHNHVVLMGSLKRSVYIYKRPYNENGDLVYAEPNRKIRDLKGKGHIIYNDNPKGVQQLGVVEILNGHRIFVLCEYKIYVFDLVHYIRCRRAKKRAAGTDHEPMRLGANEETSTSNIKRLRSEEPIRFQADEEPSTSGIKRLRNDEPLRLQANEEPSNSGIKRQRSEEPLRLQANEEPSNSGIKRLRREKPLRIQDNEEPTTSGIKRTRSE